MLSDLVKYLVPILTIVAYAIFFSWGRRWRRKFESQGVTYWSGPKEERMKELVKDVWNPRRVVGTYLLNYIAEGYVRTSITLWGPIFLLQYVGLSPLDTALFITLTYMPWSWRTFIGIASDALIFKWKGKSYRRLPWFGISAGLALAASIPFILIDPAEMPVWTGLLPAMLAMYAADAILDIAADSYTVDVVPPDYHGRVMGGVANSGRSGGAAIACVVPPFLIGLGGYRLVFIVTGLAGLAALPSLLLLKEPKLEYERVFSRRAIAFTFTEKTVLIAALTCLAVSVSMRTLGDPVGGMFALAANEIVGVSTKVIGIVGLIGTLCSVAGAVIGGFIADRVGHKQAAITMNLIATAVGMTWMTLSPGRVLNFVILEGLLQFFANLSMAPVLAMMSDVTPPALSSTVYQMYMSFFHIGRIITATIIGFTISVSWAQCVLALSVASLAGPLVMSFIKPLEAGKATKVD